MRSRFPRSLAKVPHFPICVWVVGILLTGLCARALAHGDPTYTDMTADNWYAEASSQLSSPDDGAVNGQGHLHLGVKPLGQLTNQSEDTRNTTYI